MRRLLLAAVATALSCTGLVTAAGAAPLAVQGVTLTRVGAPFAAATLPAMRATTGTSESFSSAAVGDVTGDASPDVVVGSVDGYVRVWSNGGTLEAAVDTGAGAVQASPLLTDLNGDGVLDIVTGNTAGVALAFSVVGNQPRSLFYRNDCYAASGNTLCAVFGTPAVADLDGDGSPEIIVTRWDQHLYAYHLNGTQLPGFPVLLYDTIWSSPAVGDVTGDGRPDIVVGGDCDGVEGQPCYGQGRGGYVWVIRSDGTVAWADFVAGQVVWSSPALVDLNGDNVLDVVVGTGLNFPTGGNQLFALNGPNGATLWTGSTLGRAMGSPAVGDVDGDGRPEVVELSEGGQLSVFNHDGSVLWRTCVDDAQDGVCRLPSLGTHGSAVIADVNGDGRQDVVVMAQHWMDVVDGATGAIVARDTAPVGNPSGIFAPGSAPTVVGMGGQAWIVQSAMYDANGNGARDAGDQVVVLVWRSSGAIGQTPWPTFKGSMVRRGGPVDAIPPTVAMASLLNQPSTAVDVAWSAADTGGSGVGSVDVELQDPSGAWVPWVSRAPGAAGHQIFYGVAGRSYALRARATDRAGNRSTYAPATVSIAAGATRAQPFRTLYTASVQGGVGAYLTAPVASPSWAGSVTRGFAARADGAGGYLLDMFGGVYPLGGAPSRAISWYASGWDIARGIAVNPDGLGGYVLDGFGGLHAFGNAATRIPNAAYWNGFDIARAVVMAPGSTGPNPAGYVLDGYGGLHPFGAAPPLATSVHWNGWDIAHAMALNPDGRGGYVLDGYGGLHAFGNAAARVSGGAYWSGWDIARGIVSIGNGANPAGYMLDGFGGLHPFGAAAGGGPGPTYWGRDVARSIAVAP